jgi:diketogulonate reductase-like aldo/keto reductase
MMNRRKFLREACSAAALMTLPLHTGAREKAAKIATRSIPSTAEALPIVGFGQSQSFRENDFENSAVLLDALRDLGGKFVDAGAATHQLFGRYMRENSASADLFLGSNIRTPDAATDLQAIEDAKASLGKDVLDLLQLYRPDDFRAQWPRMQRWRDEGHARHIGVAVTGDEFFGMLETLLKSGKPDFIQVNYSMLEPQSADRLLPLAQDNGVAVLTNRPFINGEYFGLVKGRELPAWTADFDCHSWAQFSLKWILGNAAVNCTLTETSKVHHAVDNLSAGLGRLPDAATRDRMRSLLQSF